MCQAGHVNTRVLGTSGTSLIGGLPASVEPDSISGVLVNGGGNNGAP